MQEHAWELEMPDGERLVGVDCFPKPDELASAKALEFRTRGTATTFRVEPPMGSRLIMFRRNRIVYSTADGKEEGHSHSYCIGWKIGGHKFVQVISTILGDEMFTLSVLCSTRCCITPMRSSKDCFICAIWSCRACTWVCNWTISLLTPQAGVSPTQSKVTMARMLT